MADLDAHVAGRVLAAHHVGDGVLHLVERRAGIDRLVHADVDAAECEGRAAERVAESTAQAIASTVRGYDSVSVRSRNIVSSDGRVTPALMPVWMINTEKVEDGKKTVYTFAINGQTGQLTCDVPYDKKKATAWFLGVFAGCFAILFGLAELIYRLGVMG